MPTPTTSSLSTAILTFLSVLLGASVPSVDPALLINSFAGGVVFITQSRDMPRPQRSGLFIASIIVGYSSAEWLAERYDYLSPSLFAFGVSASAVFIAVLVIHLVRSGKLFDLLTRRG